jgi:putative cardiolipin synthase
VPTRFYQFHLLCLTLLLAACANRPVPEERSVSEALSDTRGTALHGLLQDELRDHPGASGFHFLNTGREAFLARVALADLAERSLDMQYYIWQGDESSQQLATRILAAADRGVRVRLLLDDFYQGGARDFSIVVADRHPNVEIRLFNPLAVRKRAGLRSLELVTRVAVMKHRMHNKLFVADNQAGIVGGRNIGDVYFGVSDDHNYRDLDMLAVGSVVPEISGSFDTYWNSEWAVPIAELRAVAASQEEADAAVVELRARVGGVSDFPYSLGPGADPPLDHIGALLRDFVWASARVVYDTPTKVAGDASQNVGAVLESLADAAQREIFVVSPYLIPMSKQMAGIAEPVARGVKLRVLMNSMASTDVPVAQVAWSRHRRRLLEMGGELYELRADAPSRSLYVARADAMSRLSLHAKAAAFDREIVYIGSYNIDRLGAEVITEIGLIVESPELARQLLALMAVDLEPANAWRITLEDEGGRAKMVWSGVSGDRELREFSEPDIGWGRRISAGFLSLLPIR